MRTFTIIAVSLISFTAIAEQPKARESGNELLIPDLEDPDEIAEKKRITDEAIREKAKAAEEKAVQDRLVATKKNPKKMRVIFGATFCRLNNFRNDAITEIAKEKKYSRYGGIINKAVLRTLQQRIRHADEAMDQIKKMLRGWPGLLPAPCSDRGVKSILACFADGDSPACTEESNYFTSLVPDLPEDEEDE